MTGITYLMTTDMIYMTATDVTMTDVPVTVTNVTLMLRSFPRFKEYAPSFADSDINDCDVDDSFKETLRTAHNDGTLRAILKDSKNSNKNIILKVIRRGVAGFHQFSRYADFFRDHKW